MQTNTQQIAEETVDQIRRETLAFQNQNQLDVAYQKTFVPMPNGDYLFFECVVTDWNVVYTVGPLVYDFRPEETFTIETKAAALKILIEFYKFAGV